MPLKISVLANGEILSDSEPCSIADLTLDIAAAKKSGQSIWYFRENPAGDPPPKTMDVLDLIMSAGLPLSLSVRPDFSDVVNQEGQSAPRRRKRSFFHFWRS